MLRERACKAETPGQRDAFMIEKLTEWFVGSAPFDCLEMADVIYEFARALQDTLGFDHPSAVVCCQLHKCVPLFWPLFSAIARFVGKRGAAAGSDIIERRLEEAALVNGCRAQALATIFLANDGGQVACDLASFERDCKQSDAIIAASQRLTELIDRLS
jgi:hypothetical protein